MKYVSGLQKHNKLQIALSISWAINLQGAQ